jgi:hypothetical protein
MTLVELIEDRRLPLDVPENQLLVSYRALLDALLWSHELYDSSMGTSRRIIIAPSLPCV